MEHRAIKVSILILCLAMCVAGVYVWKSVFPKEEIYILPENHRGAVFVFYNQADGEPVKYEQGKIIFEVPKNGILKTKSNFNEGWKPVDRYFYQEQGNLLRIPFVVEVKDLKSDRIQICCSSAGKSYFDDSNRYVEFEVFYVGTKEEIESAFDSISKINPANLIYQNETKIMKVSGNE